MTKILAWIKGHLLIVILCAVSVIVLPAVVFASAAWNQRIAGAIKERVEKQERRLSAVEKTSIEVKPLAPGSPTVQMDATVNEPILNQYRALREQIKADGDRVKTDAVRLNLEGKTDPNADPSQIVAALAPDVAPEERERVVRETVDQLVDGLLPEPPRELAEELPYQIYGAFQRAHEALLTRLNAGTPPEPTRVRDQLVEFDINYRRSQFNVGPEDPLKDEEVEKLAEAMTKQRLAIYGQTAQEKSVYADASIFNLPEWAGEGKPNERQWYDWQHLHWLHSDVVEAIRKANTADGEPTTIVGSPASSVVKRIVSIEAMPMYDTGAASSGRRGAAGGRQAPSGRAQSSRGFTSKYSPEDRGMEGEGFAEEEESGPAPFAPPSAESFADPTQPYPLDFSRSISGRPTRSGLYDTREVVLILIVDSMRLPQLFEAVNSTNFMTVVGVKAAAVDPYRDLAMGYYYGPDPVAEVTLNVETAWLRDWTVPLMPQPVKVAMGVVAPESGAAGEDEEEFSSPEGGPEGGGRRGRSAGG